MYQAVARRPYEFLIRCGERLAERFSRDLGETLGPTDVLIDAPPPHREVEFRIEVYFAKEDAYRPLHAVSPVIDALARTQFDDYVKRVRVFAHPRWSSRLAELPRVVDHLRAIVEELSDIDAPGQNASAR